LPSRRPFTVFVPETMTSAASSVAFAETHLPLIRGIALRYLIKLPY
jgi:hypothetical protein